MNVQETSLEAYESIQPELGLMQQTVYDAIEQHEGISNLDISRILNIPINSVTPRVKELRDMNFVKFHNHKQDPITKRRVMTWEIC